MQYRLLIIGGGASGLAAAVTAAQCGADGVALLERLPRPGKKILATGNGRCNLSHAGIVPGDYAGSFDVSQILANFGDAVAFFEGLGLLCRTDGEGRIYPYSMTAAAVLDALRMQLGSTSLLPDARVTALRPIPGGWRAETETAAFTAERVIFAAGGHAAPKHGTDGTAWAMLEALELTLECARSPMEPRLALLFMVGRRQGGFGFEPPELNAVVPLSADGSSIWGFNSIEGDIVWRGFRVIVEYNGRLRHVARYGEDLTRANALRASGYQVFLVTSQQMRSARQMLVIGSLVAQGMGMPEPTLPERELLQRLIGEVMSYETPHITL